MIHFFDVKLLGLNISSDLRWNCHVAEISKKVASRLYFLKKLKSEYSNQRSANLLPDLYLPSNGIRMSGVSQRAFRIFIRRARTATDHKLHELFPPRNNCESNLRRKRNFNVPLAKTKRLKTHLYSGPEGSRMQIKNVAAN